MSGIKLVLTDFDGTVVQFGKHEVSNEVRQAVVACENQGIKVVAVTGRYFQMAQPVLEVLGFDDLCIFDNGASIIHARTGELVWSKWLEVEQVQHVAHILAPNSRLIDYDPGHNEHEPADNESELIDQIAQGTSHVYSLVEMSHIDETIARLSEVPDVTFYTAASTRGETDCLGIQINHAQADKYHGVHALRKILGIPKEQTLAIGDGDNDVSLFENAGIRVAMGNATEKLKAAADHIVATVDDDGFVEAMERFVLR
ncbi:MAG: yidA [Candidatus Saccharibacteria bacterium]|nr:yidA [Candidatus Saccharibacteria bacterium]